MVKLYLALALATTQLPAWPFDPPECADAAQRLRREADELESAANRAARRDARDGDASNAISAAKSVVGVMDQVERYCIAQRIGFGIDDLVQRLRWVITSTYGQSPQVMTTLNDMDEAIKEIALISISTNSYDRLMPARLVDRLFLMEMKKRDRRFTSEQKLNETRTRP